jgi:hypothetical protein
MKSLSEPLLNAIQSAAVDMRVALPASVESYDSTQQRASVKPLLARRYADGEEAELPVIAGVPVVWPRAGGAAITMPVQRGDGVLLVFSDRSLDGWLVQGGTVTPDDPRTHALSDAIAIPGLVSFKDATGHDDDGVVIGYKDGARAKFGDDGTVAVGTSGEEVLALVSELLQGLIDSYTATSIGNQPLSEVPTFTDIKSRLDAITGTL